MDADVAQGHSDQTTIVTYSVMVYFTPEFEEIVPDVEGYIAVVMAETNEGYINSEIPIRIELFCTEKMEIPEVLEASDMLKDFRAAKGKSQIKPTVFLFYQL